MALRYEDVLQNGALALGVLSAGLGASVWARLLRDEDATRGMRERGEIPILSRICLEAGSAPLAVGNALEMAGTHRLSHVLDEAGEVERILVEMWAEGSAPLGRTHGPAPERAGEVEVVGRIYAEHVLTRLFAAKEDRKVRAIDVPGQPKVPGPTVPLVHAASTFALPEGAHALDEARVHPSPVVFGLGHTDSNQHVNSLVYLRMFEDLALTSLGMLGRTPGASLRSAELAYRKPSFAGDRLEVLVRPFQTEDGALGAVGAFREVHHELSRARTFVRLVFARDSSA